MTLTPEQRDQQREWRRANPEKMKAQRWKNKLKKYGITDEQFKQMLEAQHHACKMCYTPFADLPYTQRCIDHDHATNRVRGLLCVNCNFLIGHAGDDIRVLLSGVRYLIKSTPDPNLRLQFLAQLESMVLDE